MPRFHYKAVSTEGEVLEGELQAPSHDAVIERLQALGHMPIRAQEMRAAGRAPGHGLRALWSKRRLGRTEIEHFTRDLATLLAAGVPLERALEILIELAEQPGATELLTALLEEVRGGGSLSQALEAQGSVFSRFYVNMIRAAEAGGALEAVLVRLAAFIEESNALKSTVKSALIYPAILISVTILSMIILMIFVVPQFTAMFEDMGQALPLPSRIVFASGEFLQRYWWVLGLVVIGLGVYMRRQLARPEFRYRWDRWVLEWPLIGDLTAKIEVARFARTLGTLLASGVPLLSALSIVRETLSNRVLGDAVGSIAESAKEGQGLAEPLLSTGRFPRLAAHMVRVGEETGELESMLGRLADIYDREVKAAIQRMLALMEPVLIIGFGIVIGGIIMAILVAILSVNELAF